MNNMTLVEINGEQRIHDLLLAERLGFDRPADIRKLIKRHEEKLLKFSHIATVARCVELGNGARRDVSEYYLNQKQSMFICMKSETDTAFEVQADIIHVYDAYLNGDLKQVNKSPYTAISIHTNRAVQVGNSKSINATLMEQGGRNAIVSYNLKNCTVQSGRLPAEWKEIAKAEGMPARNRGSAKDVLRIKEPQVACGMSLADQLVTGGASIDDGISIGKDSQFLFKRILALGITPPELLL